MSHETSIVGMDDSDKIDKSSADQNSQDLTATDTSQPIQQSSNFQKRTNNETSPSKGKGRRKNDARRRSWHSTSQKRHPPGQGNENQIVNTNNQMKLRSPNSETISKPVNDQKTDDQHQEVTPELVIETTVATDVNQPQSIPGPHEGNSTITSRHSTNNSRSKQSHLVRENKELKEQSRQLAPQIQGLVGQVKQQFNKIRELETALLSTTRTCNQLEKLFQQELTARTRLESENDSLSQTITRLKTQLCAHEKNKFNNDERLRVLSATLMERETEVSILKLKLTRLQTNPSSSIALNSATSISSVKQQDPCLAYATTGRSSSEFNRNSYIRSSMIAEAASIRASATQLRSPEKDASIWATVPEELIPSRRPQMLEKSFQPMFGDSSASHHYTSLYGNNHSQTSSDNYTSTPILRDRRYKTLPRSTKNPLQEPQPEVEENRADGCGDKDVSIGENAKTGPPNLRPDRSHCRITNLDDSSSTSQSSGNRTASSIVENVNESRNQTKPSADNETVISSARQQTSSTDIGKSTMANRSHENFNSATSATNSIKSSTNVVESSHYSTISKTNINSKTSLDKALALGLSSKPKDSPPNLPIRAPSTPVKSFGLRRIFDKFRRSDSSTSSKSKTDLTNKSSTTISANVTPVSSPFKRSANRSTMVASPNDIRAQMSPMRQAVNFQTDKPFAEWDTDMLVDWLSVIGLSMYANQCRRWVKCGAHIMNASPDEVDKGLGIQNHLHRKKLRLAISELNGDCDKITKAAARLDYLWVARWLDDVGLPQYKEAFINARVDGRVLNYLTVEDLASMGVRSVLHHASIRCGIRVLRSINFDLQLLKRRATAEEAEQMNSVRKQIGYEADNSNNLSPIKQQSIDHSSDISANIPLWTCHRVMEWLRLIDFAEFAPNLRGSGVHGGLIYYEDGFNIDTMCSLLSIPLSRTLLRRHLSTFFKELIGKDLVQRKRDYQDVSSNLQLNPLTEIKAPKKSQLWFSKLKSPRVGQDTGTDEYLCPMYPVEPQIIKSQTLRNEREVPSSQLAKIPESINV